MFADGKTPAINGDGTHTRDYVYVTDVARANVLALNSDFVGELNIGTKTEISTNEVFRKVVSEMGVNIEEKHIEERPGEQVTSSLDYSKATEILGWEPQVNFDEGVKRVVEWYKNK